MRKADHYEHNDICKKEHICLHEELSSQAEVFDRLAEIAYDSGIAASKEAVVNGLAKEKRKARPTLSTDLPSLIQSLRT
ncbi:PTS sugar transporter subunit IIA [Bacillus sonorensis]|nr:PTS sugar transporter subunit IIA [Bacillus sonorensis]